VDHDDSRGYCSQRCKKCEDRFLDPVGCDLLVGGRSGSISSIFETSNVLHAATDTLLVSREEKAWITVEFRLNKAV
jgi:hypothetical protein